MRVQGAVERWALVVEEVEKHERLQELAEVGRAHQPRDRSVRAATCSPRDRPQAWKRRSGGIGGHDFPIISSVNGVLARGVQAAWARAFFKAAVHHSRSSMNAWAGVSSSASPASTLPPWK